MNKIVKFILLGGATAAIAAGSFAVYKKASGDELIIDKNNNSGSTKVEVVEKYIGDFQVIKYYNDDVISYTHKVVESEEKNLQVKATIAEKNIEFNNIDCRYLNHCNLNIRDYVACSYSVTHEKSKSYVDFNVRFINDNYIPSSIAISAKQSDGAYCPSFIIYLNGMTEVADSVQF